MIDDTPVTADEEFRRKLSNHSSRLEHGDRRFDEIEIDLKSLKADRRPDWKIWLTIIAMTGGFLLFSREFIHDLVDQAMLPLTADVSHNVLALAKHDEALAQIAAGEWDAKLQEQFEKRIDQQFAEFRTLINDLKNSPTQ